MIIRLSFLEQAKNDLFELLATGSATNADAANILLSRINKVCEFLLGLHCPCIPLNSWLFIKDRMPLTKANFDPPWKIAQLRVLLHRVAN